MELIKQANLFDLLKDKHVLLDTNIIIDTSLKPSVFALFFKELRENNVTITSIDPVAIEFLRGSSNEERYKQKKEILNQIIESYLPITPDIFDNVFELIKKFGIEGKGVEMTDMLLGAVLMKYPERLFLFTKNTTDFPMNIYKFISVINLPTNKSIQTYGIYTFLDEKKK